MPKMLNVKCHLHVNVKSEFKKVYEASQVSYKLYIYIVDI